jgi:hypothetical protein
MKPAGMATLLKNICLIYVFMDRPGFFYFSQILR